MHQSAHRALRTVAVVDGVGQHGQHPVQPGGRPPAPGAACRFAHLAARRPRIQAVADVGNIVEAEHRGVSGDEHDVGRHRGATRGVGGVLVAGHHLELDVGGPAIDRDDGQAATGAQTVTGSEFAGTPQRPRGVRPECEARRLPRRRRPRPTRPARPAGTGDGGHRRMSPGRRVEVPGTARPASRRAGTPLSRHFRPLDPPGEGRKWRLEVGSGVGSAAAACPARDRSGAPGRRADRRDRSPAPASGAAVRARSCRQACHRLGRSEPPARHRGDGDPPIAGQRLISRRSAAPRRRSRSPVRLPRRTRPGRCRR